MHVIIVLWRIINLITSIRLDVEYEAIRFASISDTKIKNKKQN